jgi:phage terminase large subunit
MEALKYADVPGYAAILFRRTLADLALPGALMDRANEWLRGTKARWSEREKTWHFPSGATLSFGYLENANDHYRYQSSEFQFVGFDELTQFAEHQYLYLFSRLRRLAGSPVPLRMRAASNPGGIGHDWVRRRFITGALPPSRAFIPARVADNPHLDQAQYLASLSELDEVERARLRDGNWEIQNRGLVYPELAQCVIAARPIRGLHWGGVDWGYRNPAALLVGVRDHDDQLYIIDEVYGSRLTTDDLVLRAAALQRRYRIELWYCDGSEPGSIETFRRNDLPARPVPKGHSSILNGVQAVNARLRTNRLWVFENCTNLIRESNLYRYPTPEEKRVLGENPIDENGHALDALRYMISGIDQVREARQPARVYPSEGASDPMAPPGLIQLSTPELERALHEKQMAELAMQYHREHLQNYGWDPYP